MKKIKWHKGEIVYSQGIWKCRVVKDYGKSIDYIALEGYHPSYNGKVLSATKSLFTENRQESTHKKPVSPHTFTEVWKEKLSEFWIKTYKSTGAHTEQTNHGDFWVNDFNYSAKEGEKIPFYDELENFIHSFFLNSPP